VIIATPAREGEKKNEKWKEREKGREGEGETYKESSKKLRRGVQEKRGKLQQKREGERGVKSKIKNNSWPQPWRCVLI